MYLHLSGASTSQASEDYETPPGKAKKGTTLGRAARDWAQYRKPIVVETHVGKELGSISITVASQWKEGKSMESVPSERFRSKFPSNLCESKDNTIKDRLVTSERHI